LGVEDSSGGTVNWGTLPLSRAGGCRFQSHPFVSHMPLSLFFFFSFSLGPPFLVSVSLFFSFFFSSPSPSVGPVPLHASPFLLFFTGAPAQHPQGAHAFSFVLRAVLCLLLFEGPIGRRRALSPPRWRTPFCRFQKVVRGSPDVSLGGLTSLPLRAP